MNPVRKKKGRKINKRLSNLTIILLIIVFVLATCLVLSGRLPLQEKISFILSGSDLLKEGGEGGKLQEQSQGKPRLLDGILVSEEETAFRPIAVVIDNIIEARPASGIERASIVYEVPVEANITRFLAIFDPRELSAKIGPVRSARPYLVRIAEEYDAFFVHAGGSPQSLTQLEKNTCQVYNLDEISSDGKYFWRDGRRIPPYNLYTSKSFLEAALEAKEGDACSLLKEFKPWLFREQEELTGDTRKIDVQYPRDGYQVSWQYSDEDKGYIRWQNGEEIKTTAQEKIMAKNIVVQYVNIEVIDEIGRRKITTEGEGKALIFQQGRAMEGKWKKEFDRTYFYDSLGAEIQFIPGPTWIELVGKEMWVSY